MRAEIKTVRVWCDVCHAEIVMQFEVYADGTSSGNIPGWDFANYPDGMTKHKLGIETMNDHLELCPDCLKKIGK